MMKGFAMFAHPLIQTPHGAWINVHQPRCAFQRISFGQMLPNGDGFRLSIFVFHRTVFFRSLNSLPHA